jgi:hypothetical protein
LKCCVPLCGFCLALLLNLSASWLIKILVQIMFE